MENEKKDQAIIPKMDAVFDNLHSVKLTDYCQLQTLFLPHCRMSHPTHKNLATPPWHFILNEKRTEIMEAPYLVTHFHTRLMVRSLVGNKYRERFYATVSEKKEGETNKRFEEINKKLNDLEEEKNKILEGEIGEWSCGLSHLFCIINKDKAVFATMEAFGALQSYWHDAFVTGQFQQNTGVKILITDHAKNIKTSKSGFEYLASWKFTQFEQVVLTDLVLKYIKKAWNEQAPQIQQYLDQ